eukprot:2929956-Pyramimonas_sp.AAC.1
MNTTAKRSAAGTEKQEDKGRNKDTGETKRRSRTGQQTEGGREEGRRGKRTTQATKYTNIPSWARRQRPAGESNFAPRGGRPEPIRKTGVAG